MQTLNLGRDAYSVGIICALAKEKAAAEAMLDEEHPRLPPASGDENDYTFGKIGVHGVVIACLPGDMGTTSASAVAVHMMRSFPIKIGLMVGICGGVWSEDQDVRLGDVVVSKPTGQHGGVVQWDFGKVEDGGGFCRKGTLNKPPRPLRSAVTGLEAQHIMVGHNLQKHLDEMLSKYPKMGKTYGRQGSADDKLFEASYSHVEGNSTCAQCDLGRVQNRSEREDKEPEIHYGNIASGNSVVKDGPTRDRIAIQEEILCFEMEAAGLMDTFPCVVIRGVCDYADSHKNKRWQGYAAAVAAAYAKELLLWMPAADLATIRSASEATGTSKQVLYIPFSKNHQFVGRRAELEVLERRLVKAQDCQRLAVVGLSGMGKTQLVLSFAYSVAEQHPEMSVFWIPAFSLEAFVRAIEEIAQQLGIRSAINQGEDVKELVKRHLSAPTAGKWLLIVDNADDIALLEPSTGSDGLLRYLPESRLGVTIFTTRTSGVAQRLARSDVLRLKKPTRDEAAELLERALVDADSLKDQAVVTDILTELEHLPLAITQAAAYINTNQVSISEYSRLLQGTDDDVLYLMSAEIRDSTRYEESSSAVATTRRRVSEELSHLTPESQHKIIEGLTRREQTTFHLVNSQLQSHLERSPLLDSDVDETLDCLPWSMPENCVPSKQAEAASLVAVPEALGATSDYVSGPESGTQARGDSTLGFGESAFHDSGLGSSTRYQYSRRSNASEADAASIRSYWSKLDMERSLRDDLREHFVTRLASETETYLEYDAASEEVRTLLRDFAILLRREATDKTHHEAAKFIKSEQAELADDYQEMTRLQVRPRSEYNIHGMVDEWDAGGMQPSAYDNFDVTQHEDGLLDPADMSDTSATPEEPIDLEWMMTEEHRDFIFTSSQFKWLVDRIKSLATRSCIGDTYHSIRGNIAERLRRTERTGNLTLALKDWNPRQLFEQQHLHENLELSQVLVYCGSLEAAYACTVGEYLDYMWPEVGSAMLACIQSACNTQKPSSTANIVGAELLVAIQQDSTTISLSGHGQSVLELAEACVWLATACREHKGGRVPTTCMPRLDKNSLDMSVECVPMTGDKILTEGSCWLAMLGNPVIASGYPIPMRAEGGKQKGLEASIGVLVGLSQANWATNFQGKFMLKGLRSALVPVGEDDSSITWHFLDTKDSNRRMTYKEAHEIAINSTVTVGELSGSQLRKNFVGIWTSAARIRTGSNFAENDIYELHQSRSEPSEHLILRPSTLSITGGKFLNVGGAATLLRKDSRLARVTSNDFQFRLIGAEGWKVLFYGQKDKRAWLVDGASVLLHLSIAWLVDPEVSDSREKLAAFDFGSPQCGRPDASRVLLANRKFAIHQSFEGHKFETVRSQEANQGSQSPVPDSTYGTGSIQADESDVAPRVESKSTTSDFTYADLVEHLYQILEEIVENASTAAHDTPQLDIKLPKFGPMLIGWEAKDIIHQRTKAGRHHARTVKLKDSAKEWLGFVQRTGAIVLLAESFGDLILPEAAEGNCSRTKPLEKHRDYLAAPVYMLKGDERQRRDGKDHSRGCLQVDDHTFWHDFDPHAVQQSCACANGGRCSTVSRLGRKPKENAARLSSDAVDVFEVYRNGAAIIGQPVRSGPVQSEPVQSEPVQSEPVQSEPVQSEPVQSEPVQSEPSNPSTSDVPATSVKGRRWTDMKRRILAKLRPET